jgi:peptidoglycan/xylan/chitin deacetylase (PgdA/CDA1 family)
MNTTLYKLSNLFTFIPIGVLQKITRQNAIFPFYHLISDQDVIHVKHLYSVKNTQAFERDLDFLLKNYEAIDLNTLEGLIQQDRPIDKKVFLLSFDDGLSQFYDIIAPILRRKGIPAVNFLNSAFIDNKDLFFRYKQSILIEKYLSEKTSLTKKKEVEKWFKNKNQKGSIPTEIKSISYLQKDQLDQLAMLFEVDFQEYLRETKPYLSTEQINTLIQQGFDFGGHSIDHPLYSELPLQEQLNQTIESVQMVHETFQLDKKTFSFPFTDTGVSKSFFETIFQQNEPIADLTFGCAGIKKDSFKNHIQRIPLETANLSAQEIIRGEYLYYMAKILFNKNRIIRK